MFIRQASDGNWYFCRVSSSNNRGRRPNKVYKNWWLVRDKAEINIAQNKKSYRLVLPKSFIGERVRIKVEIIQPPEK